MITQRTILLLIQLIVFIRNIGILLHKRVIILLHKRVIKTILPTIVVFSVIIVERVIRIITRAIGIGEAVVLIFFRLKKLINTQCSFFKFT